MKFEVSDSEFEQLTETVNYESLIKENCKGKIEFYCGSQSLSFQIIYVQESHNSKTIVLDIKRNMS